MIPVFPEFKHIEWNDQDHILQFTKEFPPYSDYNFVSIWCWNTRKKMMASQLHGNLIILFYDYLTEAPFLSFIGRNNIKETAKVLIEYSKQKYQENWLKLLPEDVVQFLPDTEFVVTADEDAHDYIVSADYLSNLDVMPNNKNLAAVLCKKFFRLYPHCTIQIHESIESVSGKCIELFKRWAKVKNLDHRELNEYSAFERFVQNSECDNYVLCMYDGNKMIAFTTYELLPKRYAICHFVKADNSYIGIYDALFFTLGKRLKELGVLYWNFEQDLGIPGLRQSKRKYKPVFYLKKYRAQLKVN